MRARSGMARLAGSLSVLLVSGHAAEAGGFILRSHSAAGFGTSLAGVAAGDRLSYSFWNPAALAHVEGFEIEAGAAGILPSMDITPDAATNAAIGFGGGTPSSETDIGRDSIVPASFAAYRLNEQMSLGVALTAPFGMSTEAPDNWAGQLYSRATELVAYNVNPMLSYRINDMVSVGAGAQIQYFSAELTQAAGIAPGVPDVSLKADDVALGFNLGIQVRPWEGTTLGLGYRSSIAHDLDGRLAGPGFRIPARTDLDTPEVVSVGIRQDVNDQVRALATVEWNNWSRLGTLPILDDQNNRLDALNLEYRDGWLFSIGAEYDVSDALTLRAGLGYEIAPLTVDNRDTRSPESDQIMASAGLTYRYDARTTIDLSYLYAAGIGNDRIDIGPDNPRYLGVPFGASSDLQINVVSVGLTMQFGGPSVP